MAGPCGCLDPTVTGCQCSMASSTSVLVAGDGAPGTPFVPSTILDPASDNEAQVTADGLYVPPLHLPYCLAYASVNQFRGPSSVEIGFDVHSYDPDSLMVGDGTFKADTDGLWSLECQVRFLSDDAAYAFNYAWMQIQETSGNIIAKSGPWLYDPGGVNNSYGYIRREFRAVAGEQYQIQIFLIYGGTGGDPKVKLGPGVMHTWATFKKEHQ